MVTPGLESELSNAGRSNRMWPGLSWSPDSKDWRWVGRRGEALIPLSENHESIEWGCIFAAATPIVLDDEIRIYYSAQPGPHGWNPGHLCLATLRLDGWAGYEPKDDSKEAFFSLILVPSRSTSSSDKPFSFIKLSISLISFKFIF